MSPTIDFSNVKDGFEPMPAGKYEAVLTAYEMKIAKQSNSPYVALTFDISEPEYEGRKAWRNFSLQPQALWALKQALVAMGIDRESLSGEVDLDEVLQGAVGLNCILELDIREWNGRFTNEVKAVKA